MSNWIAGKPKDSINYLATYINKSGEHIIIKAFYAHKFSVLNNNDYDAYDEYAEDYECYYLIEGWYEVIDNWPEYSSVYVINGEVTHYQPLPKPLNKDNNL